MLSFTDRAREMVRTFIDQSGGELAHLRIAHHGTPDTPTFELTLVSSDERDPADREVDIDGLAILVPERSVGALEGATVDFVERVNESGFEVRPAASTRTRTSPERPTPSGPIAERVLTVLDEQVNPAIASHGGAIELYDVQDTEIFLEMSGGCQGCAMSRMTLRQGVERMLRQAIPEITGVHDITDHASGVNPYFEA
ncbi:MAG: NifU family protein [Longimicrobiales bacterium]|nr:NifU family protein [Longimicrobiales bacterium]